MEALLDKLLKSRQRGHLQEAMKQAHQAGHTQAQIAQAAKCSQALVSSLLKDE